MRTLACVKRVPDTGAKIVLTDDQMQIDTTSLGFTMSPHEECAVEAAVQLTEDGDGTATALTLGSEEATEQVRTALAMNADEAVLLETDGEEWGPIDVATAVANYVRESDGFDLLLFGNESADAANYQTGLRVAAQLDLPCVTGVKSIDVVDGTLVAHREVSGGSEVYEVDLPAVATVKEGLNTPRYPSMRSRMQARKASVERSEPEPSGVADLETIRLETPERDDEGATILGEGPEAVDAVIEVLEDDLEVL